jgi:hypothetical protein
MERRNFIKGLLAIAAPIPSHKNFASRGSSSGSATSYKNFFKLKYYKKRFWLTTPDEKPFFSIGLNHFDPASLRYPENIDIWRNQFGGSTLQWIEKSIVPNIQAWAFNTIGWVQDVTVRTWAHSRSFTIDEYRTLNMPYCHMLPFTQSHQWEKHTLHFDFFNPEWVEWVDYVARSHCGALALEKNLIGYFFSDCPTWIHTRPHNQWRGPILDPGLLDTKTGLKAVSQLATQYYKTIYDAIRRYDKHHLILGDRYEGNAPISMQVVQAALPYVDILSFQDFVNPVETLKFFFHETGKPVLLADSAKINWDTKPGEISVNNGAWYAEILWKVFNNPGCIGFHLCGAFHLNRARRYGLLDERQNVNKHNLKIITKANIKISDAVNRIKF